MPAARRRRVQAITGVELEAELGGDRHLGVGLAGEGGLGDGAPSMARASPPCGSMSRLPSGWPATCRRVKPRASKRPVRSSCSASVKGPRGVAMPPAITSACADADVGVGGDAGVELGAGRRCRGRGSAASPRSLRRSGGGRCRACRRRRCRRCGRRRPGCRRAGWRGSPRSCAAVRGITSIEKSSSSVRDVGAGQRGGRSGPADEVEDFRHSGLRGGGVRSSARPSLRCRSGP